MTGTTFSVAPLVHDNLYWEIFFFDQGYAESADALSHTTVADKVGAKYTKQDTCWNAMVNE